MGARYPPDTGCSSSSALSSRARLAVVLASLAIFVIPSLLAADSPAPAQHDPHDIRVTLRVRRALAQDADLSRFNLSVSVRSGIVTLGGRVPNEGFAQRAKEIAGRVQGVFQVHTGLTVGPVEPERDEAPRLPTSIPIPMADVPSGSRDPRSRGVLAGKAREPRPSLEDAARMGRPEPRKPTAADPGNAAVLLPPRPLEMSDDLVTSVNRLIGTDVRFAGIRAETDGGIVTLSGTARLLDHVMELASQVARLAGVKEVIVESVRITGR
jgi:osmotically-inducible protein OsmY